MKNNVNSLAMLYAAFTVGISWLIIIVWFTVNTMTPAISYTDGMFKPTNVYRGQVVEVQRDLIVHKNVTVSINRELWRKYGQRTNIYDLPNVTTTYEKGTFTQYRNWVIPKDVSDGTYYLHNTACYYEFNIFQKCITMPQLQINVLPDIKDTK